MLPFWPGNRLETTTVVKTVFLCFSSEFKNTFRAGLTYLFSVDQYLLSFCR